MKSANVTRSGAIVSLTKYGVSSSSMWYIIFVSSIAKRPSQQTNPVMKSSIWQPWINAQLETTKKRLHTFTKLKLDIFTYLSKINISVHLARNVSVQTSFSLSSPHSCAKYQLIPICSSSRSRSSWRHVFGSWLVNVSCATVK